MSTTKIDFSALKLTVMDFNAYSHTDPEIFVNRSGITFSRGVLETLNYPSYVQYLIDPKSHVSGTAQRIQTRPAAGCGRCGSALPETKGSPPCKNTPPAGDEPTAVCVIEMVCCYGPGAVNVGSYTSVRKVAAFSAVKPFWPSSATA